MSNAPRAPTDTMRTGATHMQVVVMGSAFPRHPEAGVDRVNVRRVRALAARAPVVAVVPTPWAPPGLHGPAGRWAGYAATPRCAEIDGVQLFYPRYVQVRGMGPWAGVTMAVGAAGIIRQTARRRAMRRAARAGHPARRPGGGAARAVDRGARRLSRARHRCPRAHPWVPGDARNRALDARADGCDRGGGGGARRDAQPGGGHGLHAARGRDRPRALHPGLRTARAARAGDRRGHAPGPVRGATRRWERARHPTRRVRAPAGDRAGRHAGAGGIGAAPDRARVPRGGGGTGRCGPRRRRGRSPADPGLDAGRRGRRPAERGRGISQRRARSARVRASGRGDAGRRRSTCSDGRRWTARAPAGSGRARAGDSRRPRAALGRRHDPGPRERHDLGAQRRGDGALSDSRPVGRASGRLSTERGAGGAGGASGRRSTECGAGGAGGA